MRTSKERLERFLSDTRVKPVLRTKVEGYEVYVADGPISPDEYLGASIKFMGNDPISREQFPNGCYLTIWHALMDDGTGPGGYGIADQLHDVESISLNSRQAARVNAVLANAKDELRKWRGRKRH